MAILGHIEIQLFMCVHINLANKQTKQNSERKEERKKEKETETERVRNVIFKGMALQSEAEAKLGMSLWALIFIYYSPLLLCVFRTNSLI